FCCGSWDLVQSGSRGGKGNPELSESSSSFCVAEAWVGDLLLGPAASRLFLLKSCDCCR
ncbi:unnamed protein product, partial [Musa hybrid cultivar]